MSNSHYYTHPTTAGYKHIPSGGSTGQILKWSSNGNAKWGDETTYTHPTTSGNKHIPSGGGSGQILRWSSDGTAKWGNETAYTHPTSSGYKHIPSGGQNNQVLVYSSSGTAKWANNGVTYVRYSGSLTASTEYYIAKASHSGFAYNNDNGGTARIRVTARDGTGRFQIILFDVYFMNHYTTGNASGGDDTYTTSQFGESRVELVGNYYKGTPLFKEYSFKTLNIAKFNLTANTSTTACIIEVTVESSLYTGDSTGMPSLLAEIGLYDTSETHNNGDGGSLIYNNDFAKTHYYTSSKIIAGSTALRNGDVIMQYV